MLDKTCLHIMFVSVLFCSVLFCFVLFCFVLFFPPFFYSFVLRFSLVGWEIKCALCLNVLHCVLSFVLFFYNCSLFFNKYCFVRAVPDCFFLCSVVLGR